MPEDNGKSPTYNEFYKLLSTLTHNGKAVAILTDKQCAIYAFQEKNLHRDEKGRIDWNKDGYFHDIMLEVICKAMNIPIEKYNDSRQCVVMYIETVDWVFNNEAITPFDDTKDDYYITFSQYSFFMDFIQAYVDALKNTDLKKMISKNINLHSVNDVGVNVEKIKEELKRRVTRYPFFYQNERTYSGINEDDSSTKHDLAFIKNEILFNFGFDDFPSIDSIEQLVFILGDRMPAYFNDPHYHQACTELFPNGELLSELVNEYSDLLQSSDKTFDVDAIMKKKTYAELSEELFNQIYPLELARVANQTDAACTSITPQMIADTVIPGIHLPNERDYLESRIKLMESTGLIRKPNGEKNSNTEEAMSSASEMEEPE